VLPLAAGGSLDALARVLGARMQGPLGRPLVVEARPGGGGNLAFEHVARSAPDGHTLLVGWDSLAINPALYPRLPYDVVRDFAPVVQTIAAPQALVVRADSPHQSLDAFLAALRAPRAPMSWASPGNGSIGHLTGEQFRALAALPDFAHVPYRGAAPALTDLLAGVVDAFWGNLPASAEHVREGRMRALAVTSATRNGGLPQIPTAAEQGFPDLVVISWQGFLAPAGTPEPVIARLNAETNAALAHPETQSWLAAQGSEPVGGAPAVLAELLARDLPRWDALVRRAGIRPD
jgi:tripartite-type tricarboxylate transporter receptor subunit TctC